MLSTDIDNGVVCDAFGVLLASLENNDSATVSDSVLDGAGDGVFRGTLQIKIDKKHGLFQGYKRRTVISKERHSST